VREVTLLGQTVNSYLDPTSGTRLAGLLETVGKVPGIWRVRFLTSHPRHVHDDLLLAIRDLPRVCEHLHLPFQSGDDAILKQMRRRYTRDEYRACIDRARSLVPDISLSTDVIVGYPGETEEQFQRTLSLLEEIRFDVVHIQGFSPRPRTTAARQPDDVDPAEKKRRINVLLAAQRRIAEAANRRWLGRTVEVLVERTEGDELSGRSRQNKTVIGRSPLGAEVGTVRLVEVDDATAWQLRGQVVS
jgi:tRNA-2-methylthio-N6-dimethylallyladenosine synthase